MGNRKKRAGPKVPRDPSRWSARERDKLRIAIVTYPRSTANGVSLERDVELVRASLLYADEVELVSVGTVMITGLIALAENPTNMLSMLGSLDDESIRRLGGEGLPHNWRDMVPMLKTVMSPQMLPLFDHLGATAQRRELEDTYANFRTSTQEMFVSSGGEGLVPAFNEGILKLSSSGFSNATDADFDSILADWLELLKKLLQDTRVRLLLDDQVGDLVRSMVDEGHVELGNLTLQHAGEASVGSGLIAKLPAFPQAPTDELISLRQDMHRSLSRYRSAVSRIAGKLTHRSFDPESAAEIDDLWRSDVLPALVEIHEGFAEHGLVRELARTMGADLKTIITAGTGAAIYVALDQFSAVNNWLATTAALTSTAAQALTTAASKRREAKQNFKQRDLFYLYEVNQALT